MNSNSSKINVKEFRFIRLVRDLPAIRSFYEEIFNWQVIDEWDEGVMYDTGASVFELIYDAQAEKPNISHRISILVSDVTSLFERLKDRVTIFVPLKHNGRDAMIFRMSDPDGFPITLFTPIK